MNDGKDFARQARAFGDNSSAGSATFKCDINPKLVTFSGTASSDTNNNNFVGVGSAFLSQVQVGDQLFLSMTTDTDIGEVKSITDNLNIELGQAGGSDENASAAVVVQLKDFLQNFSDQTKRN